MEFEVKEHGAGQAVVQLVGRLDANSAEAFKTLLKDVVATGLTHLVVDMQAVSFIDSSGLSALVSGFKIVHRQDGTLVLANVGPQTQVALEMTRLNRILPSYADVDSALASF